MPAQTAVVLREANAVRRRYVARGKKRHHRRPGFTLPLAVVGGFMPLGVGLWNRRASATDMGNYAISSLTGYMPGQGWNAGYMKNGAGPIVLGILAHKVAGKLGVNRALAKAGVPFLRI